MKLKPGHVYYWPSFDRIALAKGPFLALVEHDRGSYYAAFCPDDPVFLVHLGPCL